MTTLSPLNSASRSSNAVPRSVDTSSVLPGKVEAQYPSTPPQSTIVTVGANKLDVVPQTYSMPRLQPAASLPPVWEHPPGDKISTLMAGNFLSGSLTNRLKGLGSALLNSLKNGAGNFSQSITKSSDSLNAAGATVASSGQTSSFPLASEELTIKTKSGIRVEISLNTQDDRLAVDMKSSGELSDAERAAIGKLADAFQDAVGGLAAVPPRLDLGGLTQFDTTVLSSVDLHSSVALDDQGPQTLDFHADGVTRKLDLDGPIGMVSVNVDMRDASNWGSPKQQGAAIVNYLKQFDQAASRGKGDASLMAMFKDAFTQLNSDYTTSSQQRPTVALAENDYAMLTGLADFNASVSQMPKTPNPMHLDERNTFSYQASQSTQIKGRTPLDRSILQQQQSHLTASYHMSLIPDVPLELTTENKSQNYYYTEIDDTAESVTEIAYDKGRLSKAQSTQSASQSTHVLKYEMGKLTEDNTTPFNASLTRDILATLKPFLEDSKPELPMDIYGWQLTLENVHNQILLQTNPSDLNRNDWDATLRPQE
jgi:hypothetical protein